MRKLSQAIAHSLFDEPFYQSITVDFAAHPDLQRERLAEYFACSIQEGYQVGRVDVLGEDGAAVWITSQDPEALVAARQQKLSQMALILGPAGLANYQTLVNGMNAKLPDADSDWYLSILGVKPALGRVFNSQEDDRLSYVEDHGCNLASAVGSTGGVTRCEAGARADGGRRARSGGLEWHRRLG